MRPLMYRKYENYKNCGDKLPLNSPSIIKCKKCFLFFLSSMKPSHENFWQETSSCLAQAIVDIFLILCSRNELISFLNQKTWGSMYTVKGEACTGRMNFSKKNFFTTNLNLVVSGGGKSSNILDQTYSF